MKLNIGNHEFSIIWDQVYYFALSDYPTLTTWEIKMLILFYEYEAFHGRQVELICDDLTLVSQLTEALENKENFKHIKRPTVLTACTACLQKGCITDYVCHTSSFENAVSIFNSGKILSAVNARQLSREILRDEPRNAAHDPADYFDYLMLSWGNCQAGDRLVMERKLKRNPNAYDLSVNFTPGIRYYFEYDKLTNHPRASFDGYHALKIKDELSLDECFAIIIPLIYKEGLAIPSHLVNKVHYLDHQHQDIWQWSKTVYDYIEAL